MRRFLTESAQWATGRWWWWRAALLLGLLWDGRRQHIDPEAGGLFGGITFGVHEFGHLLFAAFGEFMAVAGGSLNQLLLPVLAGVLMYHYRDYFGIAVAGAWLASSMVHLSRYIADARAGELDLVSFGEDAVHDWTWLLGRFGALAYDQQLAGLVRAGGALVLLVSAAYGAWLCLVMARRRETVTSP